MECNFVWNHKDDSGPKLHDEVQLPLYAAVVKSQNSVNTNFLMIKKTKKAFTSHFVSETEMMCYRERMVRFKTEMMRFRTDLI